MADREKDAPDTSQPQTPVEQPSRDTLTEERQVIIGDEKLDITKVQGDDPPPPPPDKK